jgi:hypothetical protein
MATEVLVLDMAARVAMVTARGLTDLIHTAAMEDIQTLRRRKARV